MSLKRIPIAITCFCLLLANFVFAEKALQVTTGPIAVYHLNGSGKSETGTNGAKIHKGSLVPGFDGKPNSAYYFDFGKTYNSSLQNIIYPINITSKSQPVITMACWVKTENVYQRQYILGNGTDKGSRGIITDMEDGHVRWGLLCGKDGILWGPPVVNDWEFVAAVYDSKNQEARLIVGDKVFASRGTGYYGNEQMVTGTLKGAIDEVRIFGYALSQNEIEKLSGKPIVEGADDLAITDRYSYRERREKEKENQVKVGDIYIVDKKEFTLYDTTNRTNVKVILTEEDTIKIIAKLSDGWYKVGFKEGKTGFVTRSSILNGAYPQGENVLLYRIKSWFSHVFDFTKFSSWIVVVIFAILLFIIKKRFVQLDHALLSLRKKHDEFADGGGKNEVSKVKRKNFLHKIYPIQSYPWYPILAGMLLGTTLFVGSFWDAKEMEWFYNEGFNILPIGFSRPVHWFLYGMSLLTLLLTLSFVLESFVLGGPFVGLLRVFILLIINFMSLLVTFFLLILVAIVVLIMIGLWVFSNTVGSGNYRCPKCGRTFSAGSGSSVSCPGCGASLST